MAEGPPTTGMSAVQVLPTEIKTPSSTGVSTAFPTDQGVSDVTNRTRVLQSTAPPQPRAMMMEGNNYYPTGVPYGNAYSNYQGNPYTNYNNTNNFNQYSSSNNNYYGGGYNSYNRDYSNNNSYNVNNSNFKPATSYNANNASSPPEVTDGSAVDSALLAALRDSRERVALLRLEQVMIDFMNAPEGYLEVGGPYNSVVVSPNTSSKRFQSAATVTDTGGRQTSFQRCLLHRLADRFGIVRESGTILEGSIRLIKQKDSKIPKKLLLDHVDETNSTESGKSGDAEAVTSGMEDLRVSQSSAGATAKDKPKRKMKIMKRNSSVDSGSEKTKSTPKSRKSKNFTDKEKAYAEARARIFAADEAGKEGSTIIPSDSQTQSAPASVAPSPSATPPPPRRQNSSGNANAAPLSTTPVHKSASANNLNITKRMSSGSLMESNDDGLPPAAASSGVSKATWRNRKEEENDPDFQRGAGLQTLVPVVAAPTYNVPIAGNAYYYQAGGGPTANYGQPHYYGDLNGNTERGGPGAGRGGRGFVSPRGYGYPQPQQHYRSGGNVVNVNVNNGEATNVNCLEEFPALR